MSAKRKKLKKSSAHYRDPEGVDDTNSVAGKLRKRNQETKNILDQI